jgi:predicted dinucleotide-utilizing enzyme
MLKVGIVGYGHLGQYLVEKMANDKNFELVFVWNRSPIKDENLDNKYIVTDLNEFEK